MGFHILVEAGILGMSHIINFVKFWHLFGQGAKGPGSQKTYTVIPIAKVPPHLVDNRDGYVFFAEVAQYLPLEDQYKEEAKSYFREGSQFSYRKFISCELRKNSS